MNSETRKQYQTQPSPYPGCYTLHLDISASDDKSAISLKDSILQILSSNNISVSIAFVTDCDDWNEYVHHDDHPNAVRVGTGRRVVLDDNGYIVP